MAAVASSGNLLSVAGLSALRAATSEGSSQTAQATKTIEEGNQTIVAESTSNALIKNYFELLEDGALEQKKLKETLKVAKNAADFVEVLSQHLRLARIPERYQIRVQRVKSLIKEFGPNIFAVATDKSSKKELQDADVKNGDELKNQTESILVTACASPKLYPPHSLAIVEALLEAGVNPNERDQLQQTGLMHAAGRYNLEVFNKLIETEGIDVNLQGESGVTALIIVARDKYTSDNYSMAGGALQKMLDLLLQKEANPNLIENEMSAIDYAVEADNFNVIRKFINKTNPGKYHLKSLVDYLLNLYKSSFETYQKTLASYKAQNKSSVEENIQHLRSEYQPTFSAIQYCLEQIKQHIHATAKVAVPMSFTYSKPLQQITACINEVLREFQVLMPEFAQAKEANRLSTCDV